jgi:hypothetical protein
MNPGMSPVEQAEFAASNFVNRKADEVVEARAAAGQGMDFRQALMPNYEGGWSQQPHQKRAARGQGQKAKKQWQQRQPQQQRHHQQQQQRHQQQQQPNQRRWNQWKNPASQPK